VAQGKRPVLTKADGDFVAGGAPCTLVATLASVKMTPVRRGTHLIRAQRTCLLAAIDFAHR
jgi:hypothetical protein